MTPRYYPPSVVVVVDVAVAVAAAAENGDEAGRDRAGVEVEEPSLTNVEGLQKSDGSHKRLSLTGSIEPGSSWSESTNFPHCRVFVFVVFAVPVVVQSSGPTLDREL